MPKENILYSRLMWLKPIALMLYKDKFSSGFHTPDIILSIRESDISCSMSSLKTAKLSLLMITMREMFEDLPGTYYRSVRHPKDSIFYPRPMYLNPTVFILD